MSATFAIITLIELAVSILLIYGFMNEEKVIVFEQAVKRIIIGNIRRAIRIRKYKKAVSRGAHLRLHKSSNLTRGTSTTVA